jgi:hypothetical protein
MEDRLIDDKIILKWKIKKWNRAWTGSIWLRIGADSGLL